jgi:hypothetical protein
MFFAKLAVVVAVATCLVPAAFAQKDAAGCKVPFAAMEKAITMDHAATTQSQGRTMQGITAGGVNYVQINGAWKASPMTPKEMLDREHENIRTARAYHCEALGPTVVDGTPAARYRVHSESADGDAISDGTLTIAVGSGLPLAVEQDMLISGGTKMHMATSYRYTGISAPSVK